MMFILNEKKYVENAIETGDYGENIYKTIDLMAQYYYQYCGFRKVRITNLLIEYLQKNYPPYALNMRKWEETCKDIAKHTGGKPLLEIDGVWITQNEIDTLKAIEHKANARLAFTMLCIAKMQIAKNPKNSGWINIDSKTLFDAARVSGSRKQRDLKIADLVDIGLLELPKESNNLNIRVTFCDNSEYQLKRLFVSDFRELGYLYRREILKEKTKIGICKECGIYYDQLEASRMENASKICPDCIKKKRQKNKTMLKVKNCIDCGKPFSVSVKNNTKTRCDDCQRKYHREKDRQRKQNKKNFSSLDTEKQALNN